MYVCMYVCFVVRCYFDEVCILMQSGAAINLSKFYPNLQQQSVYQCIKLDIYRNFGLISVFLFFSRRYSIHHQPVINMKSSVSQPSLGLVSTWMGDPLGTPADAVGVVSILGDETSVPTSPLASLFMHRPIYIILICLISFPFVCVSSKIFKKPILFISLSKKKKKT